MKIDRLDSLSDAEVSQLVGYAQWAEESEMYYGNKEHFTKRAVHIRDLLDALLEERYAKQRAGK